MSMKFSQLSALLPYPPAERAKLSSLHSSVITHVVGHYNGSFKQRRKIILAMNRLSYIVVNHEVLPPSWNEEDPLEGLPEIDEDVLKQSLSQLYISEKNVTWDIVITESVAESKVTSNEIKPTPQEILQIDREERNARKILAASADAVIPTTPTKAEVTSDPTPKEDLFIRPPLIPQFNPKMVYASGAIDGTAFVVYCSIPEIPTKQTEISCTTDVDKMTSQALRALFPNRMIQTRASCLYERVDGLDFHPELGVILPIAGFTTAQLQENLIKYPHIFQIKKCVGDDVVSFYKTIEIDGELHNLLDVWDELPDTSKIPKNADFMKEYVVRRYLLERDVKGVQHRYEMYGTLDPFLTLFTTIDKYIEYGYTDVEELARSCVRARVSYKRSRNPVLRRLGANA